MRVHFMRMYTSTVIHVMLYQALVLLRNMMLHQFVAVFVEYQFGVELLTVTMHVEFVNVMVDGHDVDHTACECNSKTFRIHIFH